MRRIAIAVLILFMLTIPAAAFTGVTSADYQAELSSNGSCRVTMTLQLTLDSVPEVLVYPIPANATQITVNGTLVSAAYNGTSRNIDLRPFVGSAGVYSLVIRYAVADVITGSENRLRLNLDLLSGFSYRVDKLEFTVTLPGPTEARPTFSSTYNPDTIDLLMDLKQTGNTIKGTINTPLQDHERLSMTLAVTDEMFPQPVTKRWSMDILDLIMIGIGILTLLYWLITMFYLPPKRLRRTMLADGITAGEIGCRLTGQGADLTLMVLSWAKMGYILIHMADNGRVYLHKRMDMGNERDDFELKVFRKLFGNRSVVDGTGYHYAQLCRKVHSRTPGLQEQFLPGSGNPLLMRLLLALIGPVSGISLATAYVADGGWQVVLAVFLAILGGIVAWLMQGVSKSFHSRHSIHLYAGLGAALFWLLLSWPAGEWNVALSVIAAQVLGGAMAMYGGRRSETGRMNMADIFGLRYYLRTVSSEEMKQNLRNNPHYYYDLAPYALALGVDRAFAASLQKVRLPQCPWLTTGMDGHLTAPEWNQLLRDTVDTLDAVQKRLPIDRLLGK